MNCTNCGTLLSNGEKFCHVCGQPINNIGINNNYYTNNYQNINNDDELIKAYIGKKSDDMFPKVKNNKFSFNIFSLLFGPIYFLYRKMILCSLLAILFLSIIVGLIEFADEAIITLVVNLLWGFVFYPFYNYHINKKIRKIKQENPNATFEELKNICSKKGGTLPKWAVILPFAIFIIGILVATPILLNILSGKYETDNYKLSYSKATWKLENEDDDVTLKYIVDEDVNITHGGINIIRYKEIDNDDNYSLDNKENRSALYNELYFTLYSEFSDEIVLKNNGEHIIKDEDENSYIMYYDYEDENDNIIGRFYVLIKENENEFETILALSAVSNTDSNIIDEFNENSDTVMKNIDFK